MAKREVLDGVIHRATAAGESENSRREERLFCAAIMVAEIP
jgi:hypothetical protein